MVSKLGRSFVLLLLYKDASIHNVVPIDRNTDELKTIAPLLYRRIRDSK